MAGPIKSGKPSRPTANIQTDAGANSSMFKGFSEESVARKWQMKSKSLALSEIEEFEDNVRKFFDEDELTALVDSIETNGITEEIWVFHIKDGDRYIIADGHRRKKAIERVFSPNHRIEVMVRKEFDVFNEEVRRQLIKVWISTSSLKAKLTNYEEMEAIDKYCACLDQLYPEKAPHVVTQKMVYSDFWFTKAKSMKLGKIMATTKPSQRMIFRDNDISFRMLEAISKILPLADAEAQDLIMTVVQSGKIETVQDLKDMIEIRTEVEEIIPEWMDNREELIQALTDEKFDEEKKEQEEMKPLKSMSEEERYVKTIKSAVKNVQKWIMKYDFNALSSEQKTEVVSNVRQFLNLLEECGILPKWQIWG